MRAFCARNSQKEGRSLLRQSRDHIFQWDVGVSMGLFTESTGSLRNPETRRIPSYVVTDILTDISRESKGIKKKVVLFCLPIDQKLQIYIDMWIFKSQ